MLCRSITWFICIFAAVTVATNYSEAKSTAGLVPDVAIYSSRTHNPESPCMEPIPEANQTAALRPLPTLLDAGEGATVTLVAGSTRLVAHKAVLATRSPVFAAMFCNGVQEDVGGHISIPDVKGPVLRQLLAYMYTLQVPQLPSMAPQLLAAADRYGVSALKAACEQQVAAQLSAETAAAAAVLAVRHSCGSLGQAAAAFIKANIFHVLATQGWAEAMRRQPEDLIKVIRLVSDPVAETSVPPTAASRTTPTTSRSPASSSAATPTALCPTLPADDPAVSALRNLSAEEKGRRLREAADNGNVAELQALLAAGADVGAGDKVGWTALHFAARKGSVDAARCLLLRGAAVDVADSWLWQTPLHPAAANGHAAVVRLLAASGADPNASNQNRWTPLHLAAYEGKEEAVTALLEAGANRRARNNQVETPLDLAIQRKHQRLMNLLR